MFTVSSIKGYTVKTVRSVIQQAVSCEIAYSQSGQVKCHKPHEHTGTRMNKQKQLTLSHETHSLRGKMPVCSNLKGRSY